MVRSVLVLLFLTRGTLAFPHTVFDNNAALMDKIKKTIEEYNVDEIVIGEPKTISGESNPLVEDVSIFIMRLEKEFSVPIHKEPEAFSSVEASRYAPKTKQRDDSASAAIILQRFLDMHRDQKNTPEE